MGGLNQPKQRVIYVLTQSVTWLGIVSYFFCHVAPRTQRRRLLSVEGPLLEDARCTVHYKGAKRYEEGHRYCPCCGCICAPGVARRRQKDENKQEDMRAGCYGGAGKHVTGRYR